MPVPIAPGAGRAPALRTPLVSRDRRIVGSWLAAAAGAFCGLWLGSAGLSATTATGYEPVFGTLFLGYTFWAVYWGGPVCWRWLWSRRSVLDKVRKAHDFGWALSLALAISLMVWGTVFASIFGVGIHQFLRHRRSALSPQP